MSPRPFDPVRRVSDVIDSLTEVDTGYLTPCHEGPWVAKPNGYVHLSWGPFPGDTKLYLHRLMYLVEYGAIDGELDHLCSNKACGRLDHLEDVTHAVNMSRMSKSKGTEWTTST